jgi:hypothetical protein
VNICFRPMTSSKVKKYGFDVCRKILTENINSVILGAGLDLGG